MGVYIQRSAVADGVSVPSGSGASAVYRLDGATASAANVGVSVPGGASALPVFHFMSDPVGILNWGTSGYVVQFEVVALGADLTWSPGLARFDSSGETQKSQFTGYSPTSLTGVVGYPPVTFTGANPSARATDDRFMLGMRANNANMMTAQAITLRVNTADSYVEVPWTVSAPPTDQHESGGAASSVHVTASGSGTAVESADGGATAAVNITAEGAGSADQPGEQHETGGTVATVHVTADGTGTAVEHADGAATATVHVTAQGAGQTDEAPTLQVTILSPTSAQLVWA